VFSALVDDFYFSPPVNPEPAKPAKPPRARQSRR